MHFGSLVFDEGEAGRAERKMEQKRGAGREEYREVNDVKCGQADFQTETSAWTGAERWRQT